MTMNRGKERQSLFESALTLVEDGIPEYEHSNKVYSDSVEEITNCEHLNAEKNQDIEAERRLVHNFHPEKEEEYLNVDGLVEESLEIDDEVHARSEYEDIEKNETLLLQQLSSLLNQGNATENTKDSQNGAEESDSSLNNVKIGLETCINHEHDSKVINSTRAEPLPLDAETLELERHEIAQKNQVLNDSQQLELKVSREKEINASLELKLQKLATMKLNVQSELKKSRNEIKMKKQEILELEANISTNVDFMTREYLVPMQKQVEKEELINKNLFEKSRLLSQSYEKHTACIRNNSPQSIAQEKNELLVAIRNMNNDAEELCIDAQRLLNNLEFKLETEKLINKELTEKSLLMRQKCSTQDENESNRTLLCSKKLQLHTLKQWFSSMEQTISDVILAANTQFEELKSELSHERGQNTDLLQKCKELSENVTQGREEIDVMKSDITMYVEDQIKLERQIHRQNVNIKNIGNFCNEETLNDCESLKNSKEFELQLESDHKRLVCAAERESAAHIIQRWWKLCLLHRRPLHSTAADQMAQNPAQFSHEIDHEDDFNTKAIDSEPFEKCAEAELECKDQSNMVSSSIFPVVSLHSSMVDNKLNEISHFKCQEDKSDETNNSIQLPQLPQIHSDTPNKVMYKWDTPVSLPMVSLCSIGNNQQIHISRPSSRTYNIPKQFNQVFIEESADV